MRDIAKMKKDELKRLFIEQLKIIKDLIQWAEDNKVPGLFGSLIIDSNYLENRALINPNDYSHKFMKRENYLYSVQKLQELINQLEDLKDMYEKGYFNQSEETSTIDEEESNLNQIDNNEKGNYNHTDNDSPEEKSNLIQTDNETSNQNQSKRGGKRVGAGRKGFGETRKVSLTLTPETWAMIEELCEKGNLKQSKVLRDIIEKGIKQHP